MINYRINKQLNIKPHTTTQQNKETWKPIKQGNNKTYLITTLAIASATN